MATATTFPTARPEGYEWLPDEEHFDPDVHLAISEPDEVLSLGDLGYEQTTIDRCVTDVAVSSPFRLLSARGAEVLLSTARRLRAYARPASVRIENTVRGGCYRSRFLRDLCMDPAVTEAMSMLERASPSTTNGDATTQPTLRSVSAQYGARKAFLSTLPYTVTGRSST
jgi:hypothetical protein